MSFSFGAPASGAPVGGAHFSSTPTAFGGGGGFSFSSSLAPSSSTAARQPAPAPGGFSFGATSATPAPAFGSFGTAPSPAPGVGIAAPAPPSIQGFGVSTPAPASAVSFGGTSAPAPSTGFGFSSTAPLASPAPQTSIPTPHRLKVPEYDSLFHGDKFRHVKSLALKASKDSGGFDAQELEALVQEHALLFVDLSPPGHQQPNLAIRQSLAAHPEVELMGKPATLNRDLYQKILELADDLRVSEETALCLYARVSSSGVSGADLGREARHLWFAEQRLPVETLLLLSQHRLGSPSVVRATDTLLQNVSLIPNIIQAIRNYTALIQNLLHDLSQIWDSNARHAFGSMNLDLSQQAVKPDEQVVRNHFLFAVAQRQTLCHVLFFLAYHTQWMGDEVAALVDLIRDLSNDKLLRVLDPFQDVPFPFEKDTRGPATASAAAWMNQLHHQQPTTTLHAKEKDVLQWQRELVADVRKTGQPELLKCVSTLVMTVVCALDAQSDLIDRSTHQVNSFGTGNALLPPDTNSTDKLAQIHGRLNKEAAKDWKRADILGVLLASYALLLRSSPSSLSSPRGSSFVASPTLGGGISAIDVRKSWRECLEAPTELKSFTFGRLGLVPALVGTDVLPDIDGAPFITNNHSDTKLCDTAEFLLSVLSRFASSYINDLGASSDLPISRKKWEQDAEEDLRLRRSHQEQQHQFQMWSGTLEVDQMEVLPSGVDLLLRPDCMDDVIAFAVTVCSLGPDYSLSFWSIEETVNEIGANMGIQLQLVPSRALLVLDRQQEDDESLLPSYLSLLAALALAEGGAEAIHRMLSSEVKDDRKGQVTWASLIEILRWYGGELSQSDYGGTSVMKAASSLSTSTSYYYAYDESRDVSGATPAGSWTTDASGDSITSPKARDLGEASSFVLMSHLNVLSSVCRSCPEARVAVLSTTLPIQSAGISGSTELIGQDSTLMILFTLAVAPVPPDVRGAVFTTLSHLLKAEPTDEAFSKMQVSALLAWQVLDQFQILPIYLLDQYPPTFDKDPKNSVGLTFPTASTSLVSDKQKSWIPPKEMYSILYELEYIESVKGVYPSTEGFLRLLRSLFALAGSPGDLGSSWRVRSGCTPYIEYVMYLVLPRIMGTFPDCPVLPFRSSQDRSRLISRALEVIEVTVRRYQLPSNLEFGITLQQKDVAETHRQGVKTASERIGVRSLANHVISEPSINDANLFIRDWQTSSDEAIYSANANRMDSSMHTPGLDPSIPRPKSPALSILVNLLHSSGEQLLRSIVAILVESKVRRGKGADADKISLAYALYNATPPTLSSAKIGTRKTTGLPLQSLLVPLQDRLERLSFGNSVGWEERAILLALNVLCEAVVREDQLHAAVNSLNSLPCIVPVLGFRKRTHPSAPPQVLSVQMSKLSQLLLSSNIDSGVLCQITDLVGYDAVNDRRDVAIARAAIVLLLYVDKIMVDQNSAACFHPTAAEGELKLAQAFGRRLVISGGRLHLTEDVEIVSLVLNRILADLRKVFSPHSISNALLGFPSSSSGISWEHVRTVGGSPSTDCFDAILYILNDEAIVASIPSSELAAMGYEIFARLMTVTSDAGLARVQCTAERLRRTDFWRYHLTKILRHFFSSQLPCDQLLHSAAWLLKSLACEFDVLRRSLFGTPQPLQVDRLMTFLYAPPTEILGSLVRLLPVECPEFRSTTVRLMEEALSKSKVELTGAPEIVHGYKKINVDLLVETSEGKDGKATDEELKASCETWNLLIARDCATAHVSSATHLVLRSTVATGTTFLVRLPSVCTGWNNLLRDLLATMNTPICFSTAARNLALAALVVTMEATSAATGPIDTPEGNLDAASARSMAVAAISFSDRSGVFIDSDSIRHERTALLGTILSLLLEKSADVDIQNEALSCVDAATVLAQLACHSTGSRILSPSNQAIIARACLSVIFERFREATLPGGKSFQQRVLLQQYSGSTCARRLVSLVVGLDWNVAHLLQNISTLPLGSQILLESDIIEALFTASNVYKQEESTAMSAPDGQELVIGVPPFLPGHLELLLSLMSLYHEEERSGCISNTCLRILSNYGRVLERIILDFPTNVYLVQLVARCFWCVKELSHNAGKWQSVGVLQGEQIASPFKLNAGSLERRLLTLAVHIADNPLPLNFLPSLPDVLLVSCTRHSSIAVTFSSTDEKSWWESLKARDDSLEHGPSICGHAVKAADIAKTCLMSFRDCSLPATFELIVIARGLCRCNDALKAIDLSSQGRSMRNEMNVFAEHGSKLRALLSDLVVELLVILLRRVQLVTRGDHSAHGRDSAFELKKIVQVALDHSRLEVSACRSTTMGSADVDENRPDYVVELAKGLRRELENL